MSGFHDGERQVQHQAGVAALAARLEPMLDPPSDLGGGARAFLLQRELALLTARDADGALWVSALTGTAGFLDAQGSELAIRTTPADGDPLHGLPSPQHVGLLAINLVARRRLRVNGTLQEAGPDGLRVAVEEAYGNCPQHLHPHRLELVADPGATPVRAGALDDAASELVRRADTFFLGTTHPVRGKDASHRGGEPGFVRVEDGELWWPDLAGNNMFNSLGNLAVDDSAALLVPDLVVGVALQLSGTARLEQVPVGSPGDDGGTGRRVRFTPALVVLGVPLGVRVARQPT